MIFLVFVCFPFNTRVYRFPLLFRFLLVPFFLLLFLSPLPLLSILSTSSRYFSSITFQTKTTFVKLVQIKAINLIWAPLFSHSLWQLIFALLALFSTSCFFLFSSNSSFLASSGACSYLIGRLAVEGVSASGWQRWRAAPSPVKTIFAMIFIGLAGRTSRCRCRDYLASFPLQFNLPMHFGKRSQRTHHELWHNDEFSQSLCGSELRQPRTGDQLRWQWNLSEVSLQWSTHS